MSEIKIYGKFVDPFDGLKRGTVTLKHGIITDFVGGDYRSSRKGDLTHSFKDHQLIFPAFFDKHTHQRHGPTLLQLYKEDLGTYERAAHNGGVVGTGIMPNYPLKPVDSRSYSKMVAFLSEMQPTLTIVPYAGIGSGTRPLQQRVPYKAYMDPSFGGSDALAFKSPEDFEATIARYVGQDVTFHCENSIVIKDSAEGYTHSNRRPVDAVTTSLDDALRYIRDYNIRGTIAHFTYGPDLEKIIEFRKNGGKVQVEISPHQLFFDEEMIEEHYEWAPYAQMNPALRNRESRMMLIDGVRNGHIDFVATDHAPHRLFEKLKKFKALDPEIDLTKLTEEEWRQLDEEAEMAYLEAKADMAPEEFRDLCHANGVSGTPQLDTVSGVAAWLMKEHRVSPQRIANVFSYNPAVWINQYVSGDRLGRIEKGYRADINVIDMNLPWRVKRDDLETKPGWSMFEVADVVFPGRNILTINAGEVVVDRT